MRKYLAGLVIFVLCTGVCFADRSIVSTQVISTSGSLAIPTTASGSVYWTSPFIMQDAILSTASVLVSTGTGSPNVQVQLEQGNDLPVNDKASSNNFNIPAITGNMVVGADTSPGVWIHSNFTPVASLYGRFKIINLGTLGSAGVASSSAATAVSIIYNKQVDNR